MDKWAGCDRRRQRGLVPGGLKWRGALTGGAILSEHELLATGRMADACKAFLAPWMRSGDELGCGDVMRLKSIAALDAVSFHFKVTPCSSKATSAVAMATRWDINATDRPQPPQSAAALCVGHPLGLAQRGQEGLRRLEQREMNMSPKKLEAARPRWRDELLQNIARNIRRAATAGRTPGRHDTRACRRARFHPPARSCARGVNGHARPQVCSH